MLALFLIPALLSIALIVHLTDDDDDPAEDEIQTTRLADGEDTFEGGPADERAIGNEGSNEMLGGGGNDFLDGAGGNDAIDGGAGDDTLYGGDGDDFVGGGEGNDRIFLGDGDDVSSGSETDRYDAGDDFIRGGRGSDVILDARGANQVFGGLGSDFIDTLDAPGEEGEDTVDGGFGDDALLVDAGDRVTGGAGEDLFGVNIQTDRDDAIVTLTDFNPAEDLLAIVTTGPELDDNQVSFNLNADGSALEARVDQRLVAILEGLGEDDIDAIDAVLIQGGGIV